MAQESLTERLQRVCDSIGPLGKPPYTNRDMSIEYTASDKVFPYRTVAVLCMSHLTLSHMVERRHHWAWSKPWRAFYGCTQDSPGRWRKIRLVNDVIEVVIAVVCALGVVGVWIALRGVDLEVLCSFDYPMRSHTFLRSDGFDHASSQTRSIASCLGGSDPVSFMRVLSFIFDTGGVMLWMGG